jgi:hypothetical protein
VVLERLGRLEQAVSEYQQTLKLQACTSQQLLPLSTFLLTCFSCSTCAHAQPQHRVAGFNIANVRAASSKFQEAIA